MYATCLFCHARLGRNGAIEPFPVGRRLAFDAAKGRLWVVCRRCERWNLSPLEERWEAVEECERRFRATHVRAQTENIGLARLREGLELVRIGSPLRPEFAAWRYGDQFGRRRRWILVQAGLGAGAVGALALGGLAAGLPVLALGVGAQEWMWISRRGIASEVVARIPDRELGRHFVVRRRDANRTALVPSNDPEGWRLLLRYRSGERELAGADAVIAAGMLLARLNPRGASRAEIARSVQRIDDAGDAEQYLSTIALASAERVGRQGERGAERGPSLGLLREERLAAEMALHEASERCALEGELHLLARAWREAEEVAAIADDLLVPAEVRARLGESGSA